MYALLIQIFSVVLVVLAGGAGTSHVAGPVVAGGNMPEVGVQGAPKPVVLESASIEALFLGYDKLKGTFSASSTLEGNEKAYGVRNLLDDSQETAWAVKGGPGSTLTFTPSRKETVVGFWILGGYGKSARLWNANNRLKTFLLHVDEGSRRQTFRVTLDDDPNYEQADYQAQGAFYRFPRALRPDKLTLVVETVYRGSKYSDLCISGLDFITKIDTFD